MDTSVGSKWVNKSDFPGANSCSPAHPLPPTPPAPSLCPFVSITLFHTLDGKEKIWWQKTLFDIKYSYLSFKIHELWNECLDNLLTWNRFLNMGTQVWLHWVKIKCQISRLQQHPAPTSPKHLIGIYTIYRELDLHKFHQKKTFMKLLFIKLMILQVKFVSLQHSHQFLKYFVCKTVVHRPFKGMNLIYNLGDYNNSRERLFGEGLSLVTAVTLQIHEKHPTPACRQLSLIWPLNMGHWAALSSYVCVIHDGWSCLCIHV